MPVMNLNKKTIFEVIVHMYKVLVTDSLDNVYHSPRWKVGDDNDCLNVWWPWSDHVILITCHHQLSLSLYKFVVSHITVQSVLKHRSPGDFMNLRPGVERGNQTSYSSIMRIVLYSDQTMIKIQRMCR